MNPVVANDNDHNAKNASAYRVMVGACKWTQVYVSKENYIYSRDKSYGITVYLRCVDVRHGCRGTAQIVDGMFAHCREHNHKPDPRQEEKREIKASLKRRAETTRDPLRVVYDQEVNERGGIVDVTYREMEPTMTKRRKTVQKGVPQTPNEFNTELRDEPLYCCQVKSGDEYALIFASIEASNVLNSSEEVHVDATFKVVPTSQRILPATCNLRRSRWNCSPMRVHLDDCEN